ncbi:hypothetical protein KAT92_05075, partial [Candidatus Babeliales bacterium]|nr:hypothetical protein [Candidatus Babeliales bacterium]
MDKSIIDIHTAILPINLRYNIRLNWFKVSDGRTRLFFSGKYKKSVLVSRSIKSISDVRFNTNSLLWKI